MNAPTQMPDDWATSEARELLLYLPHGDIGQRVELIAAYLRKAHANGRLAGITEMADHPALRQGARG